MLLAVEMRFDQAAFTAVDPQSTHQVAVVQNVTFNRSDHRNGLHVAGGGDSTVLRLLGAGAAAVRAMQKVRIVILGFGTARQKRVFERWTNPKPLQDIWDRAAI
jgi:hypothetical protein